MKMTVVAMNRWYEHNDNHCSAAEQHYYRLAGYCWSAGYWWIHKLADPLNQEIGPMSDTTLHHKHFINHRSTAAKAVVYLL